METQRVNTAVETIPADEKVMPNLFLRDTVAESSYVMKMLKDRQQIPIISPPHLDLSLSGNVPSHGSRGNASCSRTRTKCLLLSRIWPLGQICEPLDFLIAILSLSIPVLRYSTQGNQPFSEVEIETIPGGSYIWKMFPASILYPGENNMYLNGAWSLWNIVLLDTKYFWCEKHTSNNTKPTTNH